MAFNKDSGIMSLPGKAERVILDTLSSAEQGTEKLIKKAAAAPFTHMGNIEQQLEQQLWKAIKGTMRELCSDESPSVPKKSNDNPQKSTDAKKSQKGSWDAPVQPTPNHDADKSGNMTYLDSTGKNIYAGDQLIVNGEDGETSVIRIKAGDSSGDIIDTSGNTWTPNDIERYKLTRLNNRDIFAKELSEGDAVTVINDGRFEIFVVDKINIQPSADPHMPQGSIIISDGTGSRTKVLSSIEEIGQLMVTSTGVKYSDRRPIPAPQYFRPTPQEVSDIFDMHPTKHRWAGIGKNRNIVVETSDGSYIKGPGIKDAAREFLYPVYENFKGEKYIIVHDSVRDNVLDYLSQQKKSTILTFVADEKIKNDIDTYYQTVKEDAEVAEKQPEVLVTAVTPENEENVSRGRGR